MPRPEQYVRIASRFCEVAKREAATTPEASMFASYHSLESIAAAWIRHCGQTVPRGHVAKLRLFLQLSSSMPFTRVAAVLLAALNGVRNQTLYPVPRAAGYDSPDALFSPANATDAQKRVDGFRKVVAKQI